MNVRMIKFSLVALAAGIAIAMMLALKLGSFAVDDTPVVAGVPLASASLVACVDATSCPTMGDYYSPIYITSTYTGWAEVTQRGVYADKAACADYTAFAPMPTGVNCVVTAWKWNGSWVQGGRKVGVRVWVQPFATGWTWTWTSATGWRAMQSKYLVSKWEPMMVAT